MKEHTPEERGLIMAAVAEDQYNLAGTWVESTRDDDGTMEWQPNGLRELFNIATGNPSATPRS